MKRLLKSSDVLVENFKAGTLEKYGLSCLALTLSKSKAISFLLMFVSVKCVAGGYKHLKAEFPSLVYCSITGFGQTGPYSPRPGYDALVQVSVQ